MEKVILQHIIESNSTNKLEKLLYKKTTNKDTLIYRYDTYFNVLPIQKILEYTIAEDIYFEALFTGNGKIEIFSVDCYNKEHNIYTDTIDNNYINIKIQKTNDILIAFKLYGEKINLVYGNYYSYIDKNSIKNIQLSIGICTYKRESFVKNTINSIYKLSKYDDIKNNFNVFISDNGNSLELDKNKYKNLYIYKNKNTGGAGGFSRVMYEILDNSKKTTHVILMDDDIKIEEETLYRTYSILRILNNKYSNYCIGGQLLDLKRPNICKVNTEVYNCSVFIKSIDGNKSIFNRKNIIYYNSLSDIKNTYQAWWYCCLPITYIKSGFSYPIFFQFDDIEYSIRNKYNVIHMTGIGVWHLNFDIKVSNSKDYFTTRNILIVNTINNINKIKTVIFLLYYYIAISFLTYNYLRLQAIEEGFRDYFRGPEAIPSAEEYSNFLNYLSKFNEKKYPVSELEAPSEYKLSKANFLQMFFYIITVNGSLLPNCFLRKTGFFYKKYNNIIKNFYFSRKFFYIFKDGTYSIRKKDSKLFLYHTVKIICFIFKFILFDKIKYKWKNKKLFSNTKDFWKKYLGL